MKVLQLGPYPPPHGGVQTNLVAIRRYLRERGHSCAVINLTRFRGPDADDVYYPKSALAVLGLLFRLRYDILHLHIGGFPRFRLLALALLCGLVPGCKAVLTFHSGGYPESPEGLAASPHTLRGFIFQRFDRIIAVNPELQKLFHRFGVSPDRIRLIHPYSVAAPQEIAYPEALKEFVDSHAPFLLTVGLLEPEYDLTMQIDVLGRIRDRHPKAGLLIAGAGSLEASLRRHIQSKPYADHVLLWGDLPHPLTLRAIAECDLLLRTSLYDGDSIAVREALGLGTPVIATDNGMRPADVQLIPPSNPEALSAAIEDYLSSGGSERRRPEPDDRNIKTVFELYQELASST